MLYDIILYYMISYDIILLYIILFCIMITSYDVKVGYLTTIICS